jgi:hypothetical protein
MEDAGSKEDEVSNPPESPFRMGEHPGEKGPPHEVYAAAAVIVAILVFLAYLATLILG